MKLEAIVICILIYSTSFAQKPVEYLRKYNLQKASELITDSSQTSQMISWQIRFLQDFDVKSASFNSIVDALKPQDLAIGDFYYYLNLGDYYFFKFQDKNLQALHNYKQALELANNIKNKKLQCEALKKILTLHRLKYLYDNNTFEPYLTKYKKVAYDDYELAHYHYFNLILNFKNFYVEKWDTDSETFLNNFFKTNSPAFFKGNVFYVYASYAEEKKDLETAMYYSLLAERAFNSIEEKYKHTYSNQLYSYISRISLQQQNFEKARYYIEKSTKNKYSSLDYIVTSRGYYYKSVLDSLNGDFFNAYENAKKYRLSIDSLDKVTYNETLNELEVKYNISEKEKDILLEKQKKERNKNISFFLGSLLLLGVIIFILYGRNVTKKQQIIEQERKIEIQKTEKLLKEQELATINAMIEGQEKERQRLASDLHDSVGATLAAARLQFDHLSKQFTNEESTTSLVHKTSTLLSEAYQEIRAMAHLKNSGVIAKKGLLPALEKLAYNASSSAGLQINIEDFGLEKRLENTLEITLFRIIQELITNIIKHAQATEANIAITQHEHDINIIIEDNGKGFIATPLKKENSMGLSNIEKRVEHLEGTMEIDSTLGKGTTIIIEIPLVKKTNNL